MRNLVFVLLIGCSGGSKPAPDKPVPPTSSMIDCPMVASHVTSMVGDKPKASPQAIKDMVESHCTSDKWNDETKQCLHAAKTIAEARACAAKMTDEQRASIKTAAQALRKDATPPGEPDEESDWIRHVVEETKK